jgi:hypothetical protein
MTQCDQILAALKQGVPLTPIDALKRFNCFRLAARIRDLREEGHVIVTETIERNGKTFASYRYVRREPIQPALFDSTV